MAEFTFSGNAVEHDYSSPEQTGLGIAVLLKNALWFISIRWIVIGTLLLTGAVANIFPELFDQFGLLAPRRWPVLIAIVLSIANPAYVISLSRIKRSRSRQALQVNLWMQIFVDLTALTALVHYTGSIETPIAITYLFHVALACIFFSPGESLLVTLLASALFLICVGLETAGIIKGGGILVAESPIRTSSSLLVMAGSAAVTGSWFVVWYLVSSLSKTIQVRDARLSETNKRLQEAMESKNRQMLRTVHDLKAPFASIETMIMSLQYQKKENLPENVADMLERIVARTKEFRGRIQEMMTLGNMRSLNKPPVSFETLDLADVLSNALKELTALAESKHVKIELASNPCKIKTNRHYLSIIVSNLLSNAITYSYDHGTVSVSVNQSQETTSLTIEDHGIGISEEALPRIFDEFYRTSEAVSHNSQSTGLGLAIVKEAAKALKIIIKVSSKAGSGSKFTIEIHHPKD